MNFILTPQPHSRSGSSGNRRERPHAPLGGLRIPALALVLAFHLGATPPDAWGDPPNLMWGKVTQIYDGDTIAIKNDQGESVRVQLAYIDAPDKDHKTGAVQPLHNESKKTLSRLIMGKEVIIESFGTDKFGRIEGIVFLDKLNVNLDMVLKGMAEVYYPVRVNPERYKKEYVEKFLRAEKIAKKETLGVWGRPGYVSPYEFRRRNK